MNIEQIKQHFTCFDLLGEPLKKRRSDWLYRVPWREDKNPSLSVTINGKGWKDLGRGDHGGIIEMAMRIFNTTDFNRICAEFARLQPGSFSFSQSKIFDEEGKREVEGTPFASFEVVPLQSRGLYAYLTSRRINTSIARQFLQEAHYSFEQRTDGRYLYALAYPNDHDGYELRGAPYRGNPDGFKGGTSPKGITTHLDLGNAPVVVFEGFMDMLSFATLCGGVRHNYLVLNSVVNAPSAIEALKDFQNTIYLALDNDDSGENTTRQMLEQLPSAIDIRGRFAPFKDLNDFLTTK